jgi:large subunit ribosomal protein L39e
MFSNGSNFAGIKSIVLVLCHGWNKLTLKKRINETRLMPAHKNTSRKIRLLRRTAQNRPVPAWVIIRTHRHVRTNPKRRLWRRTDVNVG